MDLLQRPTRHLFFTGKGGVGKTALSCAIAIALADQGKRVLLLSTDPASNLDEMLGVTLNGTARDVPGVPHLRALNIDPDAAAEAYRDRVLAPYRDLKTSDELREMREELSGACTTELASFDQFAGLIGGSDAADYDHVIFDTAPTGHTLRLLTLPRAWTTFLDSNPRGASCLGPHSGMTLRHDRFAAALAALEDPAQTTLVLVSRADDAALREAARSSGELKDLGLKNQHLVVNAIFRASKRDDVVALALEARGALALDHMPAALKALPRDDVPLRGNNMVGLSALRALLNAPEVSSSSSSRSAASSKTPALPTLASLLDELGDNEHLLLMVMGKGGVGKTTIAAAIAVALAHRGKPVHLSTTDPAAHVANTIDGAVDHLEVSRIDPAAEVRAYTDKVVARKGADLDDEGKALLVEDLRSPCTEEVAVFHAFSRIVSEAGRKIVVLDTAPTGHTLLLLDATGAYHRDVTRDLIGIGSDRVRTPLMRLQDPGFTKILLVTLAETTPVSEAAALQEELRRAGIEPWGWVINSSLAATGTADPLLQQRVGHELDEIERVRANFARRFAVVPWVPEPPVGEARLLALVHPSLPT